ncbi:MAG: O-antigen ligase family protein [Flavobacteriales bacterium]|nr:O-antigen ligase family protein [Flavobacteriales bacterium]
MKYTLKQKFIDNLITFMLIMSTGGLLFVLNRNLLYALFIGLLIFSYVFFGKKLNKGIINSSIITLISVISLFIVNYFFAVSEQSQNKYAYYIMVVSVSVIVLTYFKNNRTNSIFVNRIHFILKLVVYHALFNFIAFFFIKNNLSIITSTYHESESFLNIFFYSTERGIVNVFGIEFCRNQGLFWEPGVLQAFLNMFFFLEAFIIKEKKSMLLLSSFAILTTYSTTGLAILLIQGGVYVYNEFRANKLLIPLVFISLIPVYMMFSVNVDEKIQGEKEASFQKRLFDLTQPFFIALENPLTGIGLDIDQFTKMRQEFYFSSNTLSALQQQIGIESKVSGTDKGSSNSVMFLLAAMGFPTAILFLYMFFKQQIIKEKKWLWMIIMLISVMSEPLLLRPFFFLFIISGFTNTFYKITSHQKQLI